MESIDLDNIPKLWRGVDSRVRRDVVPSGFAHLDAALCGGWPASELMEWLVDQEGIGELQLLVPLIRALQDERRQHLALWINAPYEFNAVALIQQQLDPARQWYTTPLTPKDTAYCIETSLRSQACALVIGWLPTATTAQLRRIKLACASTRTSCVLFRHRAARDHASPAGLRAVLSAQTAALHVEVFKLQGHRPAAVDVRIEHGPVRAP